MDRIRIALMEKRVILEDIFAESFGIGGWRNYWEDVVDETRCQEPG